MENVRQFIQNVDLNSRLHDEHESFEDAESFRAHCLEGFEKLMQLKDKYAGRPALVMGLGPSLLQIEKEKYRDHLKIVCNDFHRVPKFFDDNFKPDFWCAANNYDTLKDPFKLCVKSGIGCFVTIPKKTEFEQFLKLSEGHQEHVFPWIWEHRVFQVMLAQKYKVKVGYSHCNTVTNHMIAFALWLGSSSIEITGFDMSYRQAMKETGMTHAGFNYDSVSADSSNHGHNAFDDRAERNQIINDLKYLCTIANHNNITVINRSHVANGLPEVLA
tara:strand:+ start:13709 stop:14527 length:819 start_codon:yes stop_codon:yes gene_type:complete